MVLLLLRQNVVVADKVVVAVEEIVVAVDVATVGRQMRH